MSKSPQTKETVQETLDERGVNYGSYEVGTTLRAEIMQLILNSYKLNNGGNDMPKFYEIAILDIVNKLSRLASCPTHVDSWHDIQGYAKLVEDLVKKV